MPTAYPVGGKRRSARPQEPPVRLTRRGGIGGCPPEGGGKQRHILSKYDFGSLTFMPDEDSAPHLVNNDRSREIGDVRSLMRYDDSDGPGRRVVTRVVQGREVPALPEATDRARLPPWPDAETGPRICAEGRCSDARNVEGHESFRCCWRAENQAAGQKAVTSIRQRSARLKCTAFRGGEAS